MFSQLLKYPRLARVISLWFGCPYSCRSLGYYYSIQRNHYATYSREIRCFSHLFASFIWRLKIDPLQLVCLLTSLSVSLLIYLGFVKIICFLFGFIVNCFFISFSEPKNQGLVILLDPPSFHLSAGCRWVKQLYYFELNDALLGFCLDLHNQNHLARCLVVVQFIFKKQIIAAIQSWSFQSYDWYL